MADVNVAIKIAAVDKASGPIGSIKNALSGLGDTAKTGFSGLQNIAVIAGGAALAGVGALGAALYTSVGAAMDAQMGQAELAAVLESTKLAAGMTAEAVNDLASKFQAITPFEDDVVLAGENMLLTFTNIGKDVFPQATEAMLNMGQKFGSVDAAAVQLGKALNDPIAGVSALRKVGVTLTEAQEASIKAFMEQGDIASAQKIILGELETEFGGLAEAAGNTLTGKLAILTNTFGDIQETIGAALLPALTSVADLLLTGLNSEVVQTALAGVTTWIQAVVDKIGFLATVVQSGGIERLFIIFEDGTSYLGGFLEVMGLTETQAQSLAAGLINFTTEVQSPILQAITQFVSWKDALIAVGLVVASVVLPALYGIVAAAAPVIAVGAALVGAIALVRNAWENDWGGIRGAVEGAWAVMRPAFEQIRVILDQFITAVLPPLQLAWQSLVTAWQTEVGPALSELWTSLQDLFVELGIGTGDTDLWQVALGALRLVLGSVVVAVQGLTPIIHLFAAGIKFGIDQVRGFVEMLTSLKRGAEQIIAPLEAVANKIGDLIDTALDMPDWLIPGSPTPFETGLRGIGSAMNAMPDPPAVFNLPSSAGLAPGLFGTASPALAPAGVTINSLTIQANSYEEGQAAGRGFVEELRSRGML